MNPFDIVLWALAALAVVLILFVITVVLFLLVMITRRAVTKPSERTSEQIINSHSEKPRGR